MHHGMRVAAFVDAACFGGVAVADHSREVACVASPNFAKAVERLDKPLTKPLTSSRISETPRSGAVADLAIDPTQANRG